MTKSNTPRHVAVALITRQASIKDDDDDDDQDPSSKPEFLVVSSRKHEGRWVLPKGGIESKGGKESFGGKENAREAAEREAWEEAGLVQGSAKHLYHLIESPDRKPHKNSPTIDPTDSHFIPSTIYSFEVFKVPPPPSEQPALEENMIESAPMVVLAKEWPERHERQRKWVQGWEELENVLCWGRRDEVMKEALELAKKRS